MYFYSFLMLSMNEAFVNSLIIIKLYSQMKLCEFYDILIKAYSNKNYRWERSDHGRNV